ncbi:MAG: RHS repeat-associated core domain-containing protein, partial [Emticicia sp.]|nr:RHS repeat-associated core domain-containing protein [Emticicia sp.]
RSNNTFGIVDNLAYTYNANSNKIQEVKDNSTETASFADAIGTTDYTYNPDGSLKSDANKGINLFEYNYLKLLKKITFADGKTISYQYLSNGKKLKETTSTGDITDYVGNVIYKNGVVYQITNDEGRVIQNASGGYGYEYDIKDHLGSLRVSFKDSLGIAKTTQESHTGVFGEILASLTYINTPKPDNFDYTGHERLKSLNLGYIDAGARLYDPFVPRFTTIDPLSEISRRFSPFTYGNNNPIRFIDPDGMSARNIDGSVTFSGYAGDDGNGNISGTTKGDISITVTTTNDKEKGKTIMIAFSGLDGSSENVTETAGNIINDLSEWAKANGIPFVGKAVPSSWGDAKSMSKAIDFIRANYEIGSNDKLVIYGYSWGGDNAVAN